MPATCPICHERSRDRLPCHDCWRKRRRRVEALPSLDQELGTTIRDRLAATLGDTGQNTHQQPDTHQ